MNRNGRIINVSSIAYLISAFNGGLNTQNLNGEVKYDPWLAYGQSKLVNILLTKELQRRVDERGIPLEVVALHPGVVRTDLPRYLVGEKEFTQIKATLSTTNDVSLLDRLKNLPAFYFTKSVERGANSQIWLAAGEGGKVAGKFYQNMRELELLPAALDMSKAKK